MSEDALDLLLSGVKDQGQRKQITTAYYAFANGDSETFAVQFAVLLRAHATSLKLLPSRLEKTLATEIHKMTDLVIAHQRSVEKVASLINQPGREDGVGEGPDAYTKIQHAIENQLAVHAEVLRTEREKITFLVTTNGRLLQRFAGHRLLLTVILGYVAGLLTILIFDEFISFFGPMLH